jgi:hypothetical protein
MTTLTPREINRLREFLKVLPISTSIELFREVTSEFGSSLFVRYTQGETITVDLTETDNF